MDKCVQNAKSRCVPACGRRKQNGFTLVELMIVVGIIGILASVAIPNFKLYKYKVVRAELTTNVAAIYRGASAYYHAEHVRGAGTTSRQLNHCMPGLGNNGNSFVADLGGGNFTVFLDTMAPPTGVNSKPHTYDFGSQSGWASVNFAISGSFYGGYVFSPNVAHLPSGFCGLTDTDGAFALSIVGMSDMDENAELSTAGFGNVGTVSYQVYAADGQLTKRNFSNRAN